MLRIFEAQPQRNAVLDPRVNYLMVSLMQEVMRSGTAAGVRAGDLSCLRRVRPVLRGTAGSRVHFEADLRGLGWLR